MQQSSEVIMKLKATIKRNYKRFHSFRTSLFLLQKLVAETVKKETATGWNMKGSETTFSFAFVNWKRNRKKKVMVSDSLAAFLSIKTVLCHKRKSLKEKALSVFLCFFGVAKWVRGWSGRALCFVKNALNPFN